MKYTYIYASEPHVVDLMVTPTGYRLIYQEQVYEIRRATLKGFDGLLMYVNGKMVVTHAAQHGNQRWVSYDGSTYLIEKSVSSRRARAMDTLATENHLRAPMPGQVREVQVAVGDSVKKGQTLLLLEAMKMEMRVQAPRNGTIHKLHVEAGESVEKDQILVEIT